jgi:hypothetical protein
MERGLAQRLTRVQLNSPLRSIPKTTPAIFTALQPWANQANQRG